jgi:hypothetical protein
MGSQPPISMNENIHNFLWTKTKKALSKELLLAASGLFELHYVSAVLTSNTTVMWTLSLVFLLSFMFIDCQLQ